MQSAARTYFQTQVTTTTQGDLVIMLFDAALKFLRQAKEKIEEKNYAQKGILISRALDILAELQGSLNAQKGGDLADRLQKLYFFCSTRLLAANLKMDTGKIDEVMQILGGLREAFSVANSQVATKTVPTSPTHGVTPLPGAMAAAAAPIAKPFAQAVYLSQSKVAASQAPAAAPTRLQSKAAPLSAVTQDAMAATETTAEEELSDAAVVPGAQQVATAPVSATTPVRRVMAAYAASRPQQS